MREMWKDEQRKKGKEIVILFLSEKHKVQGEVTTAQRPSLCFGKHMLALHIQGWQLIR